MATLGNLYDILDWTQTNADQDTLQRVDGFSGTDEDFLRRWRCALLEQAIQGEPGPRRDTAIRLLQQAGVWDSIPDALDTLGATGHGNTVAVPG